MLILIYILIKLLNNLSIDAINKITLRNHTFSINI